MPGMEIFLRAPQVEQAARSLAQSSQQAATAARGTRAAAGAGTPEAQLMAANPGMSMEAARRIASTLPPGTYTAPAISAAETARVDRMLQRSAVIGDTLMRRATALRAREEEKEEEPGTLEKAASNLFGRRSRLLGMGGVNPAAVVSRIGAALEEVSPAAAGAAAGLFAVAEGTRVAVQHITELGAAATTSGGTGRQVAFLAGIGIDPGAIAGRAMALRQRLASDPYAISAGQSLGIGPQLPMPFGSQNVAAIYVKALEGLRALGEGEEQLRRARMLGLEADLALINTSDRYWNQTKAIADLQAQVASPESVQAARDLSAAWDNLKTSALMAVEAATKPIVPVAAEVFKDTAGAISVITNPINAFTDRLQTEMRALGAYIAGDFAEGKRLLDQSMGKNDATKEHTDAMREHSRLLREGTFGGGERARGALPSALRGQMLRDAMDGHNVTFGAWSV